MVRPERLPVINVAAIRKRAPVPQPVSRRDLSQKVARDRRATPPRLVDIDGSASIVPGMRDVPTGSVSADMAWFVPRSHQVSDYPLELAGEAAGDGNADAGRSRYGHERPTRDAPYSLPAMIVAMMAAQMVTMNGHPMMTHIAMPVVAMASLRGAGK